MYFRFGQPYCYFRLSFVVEITVFGPMVDSPKIAVGKQRIGLYRFSVKKRPDGLFPLSAVKVRKNRSEIIMRVNCANVLRELMTA